MTPIRKLFIANRAEIALRIVRTARRLGIETVVPWHAADRHGPALREADQTVQLFGEPPVAPVPSNCTCRFSISTLLAETRIVCAPVPTISGRTAGAPPLPWSLSVFAIDTFSL